MADVKSLSIFTGSGFHDTGVELGLEALGHRLRPVGYIERDAAAAATLLARMGTKTLGRAPVWCDCISRVDAKPLRGFVDLLIASPPCQPYSSAGKRLGTKDHRSHGDGDGPLVHLARIFDECRPAVGWFENVGEWFTGGHFREFGEELCRMGYDIQEPIFSSSAALGNVHERERVFCMVHAQRLRAGTGEQGEQGQAGSGRHRPDDASGVVGNADGGRPNVARRNSKRRTPCGGRVSGPAGAGREPAQSSRRGLGELWQPSGRDRQPDGRDEGLANTQRNGRSQQQQPARQSDAQDECPRLGSPSREGREGRERAGASVEGTAARGSTAEPGSPPLCPPGRDDYLAWARLAAQGLDTTLFPAIESGVSVVADENGTPTISNSDLLRLGGNAVDPIVVADAFIRAWRMLWNSTNASM